MASRDTATPVSSTMDSTPLHKAPKDRKCPYCYEMFTSSSLGRHLDQFIKEDKPKPPDGKHNVEEIRNTRGAVTRRQARTSSAKRDSSSINPQAQTPEGDAAASPPTKRARLNGNKQLSLWNTASLESTGVLPELAMQGTSVFEADMKSSDIIKKQREAMQERDDGRAAKLALIELLDNIMAAESQLVQSSPYPFHFLAQSFPALVLLVLPRQPTILSSQLIPNAKCWPIDPPTRSHYDQLRSLLSARLDELAAERRNTSSSSRRQQRDSEDIATSPPSTSSSETAAHNDPVDSASHFEHLDNAYAAWDALTEPEKQRQYHLEFARAFAREQEAHAETRSKLDKAEKRIAHNEIQIARLSELQQPTELLKSPGRALPYAGEVARLVAEKLGSAAERVPAAEDLIKRWRPSVQANRGWQRGFAAQLNAANAGANAAAEGADGSEGLRRQQQGSGASDGVLVVAANPGAAANGVDAHGPNGTSSSSHAAAQPSGGVGVGGLLHPLDHDGGDSVDASGEEDDMMQVMPPANSKNSSSNVRSASSTIPGLDGMIDPHLGGGGGAMDLRDSGDFGAAGLLADMNSKNNKRPR